MHEVLRYLQAQSIDMEASYQHSIFGDQKSLELINFTT